MLSTRTITADQLTPEEIQAWEQMVRRNPALCSPFFLPQFALAVGRVNSDVRIVVAESDGRPVAFFPFQRAETGEPAAIGESLNDFQGIISCPEKNIPAGDVLKSAGIQRLFCAKLLDWQDDFQRNVIVRNPAPYVDLTDGYAAWEISMQKKGSSQLKQVGRKERKLIRECGPIRFEFRTDSQEVLTRLIEWKRDQYRRTNERDALAPGWPMILLHDLLRTPVDSKLQPALSAMYAGDHLVAAHYGLTSDHVYHWWFPTYNPEFGGYSPGKILLRRLLFEAPKHGITRFDFGVGHEDYKFTFANKSVDVSRAIVDNNAARRWLRTQWYHTRIALKGTPIGPGLRRLRRQLRQLTTTAASCMPRRPRQNFLAVSPGDSRKLQ